MGGFQGREARELFRAWRENSFGNFPEGGRERGELTTTQARGVAESFPSGGETSVQSSSLLGGIEHFFRRLVRETDNGVIAFFSGRESVYPFGSI